jgi:hypothetical protein
MPQAPDRFQPIQPALQDSLGNLGFGYADQPHPFWKALEGVVNGLRGMQTSKAPWGMHEPTVTAGAGVEQGLNTASDVMADPRNAWMGLGPVAGMARFRRIPDLGRDLGGFHMPTSQIRKERGTPRPNLRMGEVPGGTEKEVRDDYVWGVQGIDSLASAIQDETHPLHDKAVDVYKTITEEGRQQLEKVMKGQAALEGEKLKTRNSTSGGAVPPYWFMPKDKNQIANELDMKRRQDAYQRWTERGE